MATQNDSKDTQVPKEQAPGESMGLAGAGNLNQHNDWGASEAGVPAQGGATSAASSAGTQHNDWGHAKVPVHENEQSAEPAEEAGELQTGLGGIGSLATGNAGSRQAEGETQPGGERGAMQSGDNGNAQAPESGGQRTRQ